MIGRKADQISGMGNQQDKCQSVSKLYKYMDGKCEHCFYLLAKEIVRCRLYESIESNRKDYDRKHEFGNDNNSL